MTPQQTKALRKYRWRLFLLGKVKIPMIGFVRPKLVALNDDMAELHVKLRRRTKNHLNSMYFGALAVGADTAAGLLAFYFAEHMGKSVSFAFKGMKGDFIQRAESHVRFICKDGHLVKKAMEESEQTGERRNQPVFVEAFNAKGELVATFEMIVSVKVRS